MRDAERIDRILKEIAEIWKEQPDTRLGQLLLNAIQDPTLYYIEDEKLIEKLREHNQTQKIIMSSLLRH